MTMAVIKIDGEGKISTGKEFIWQIIWQILCQMNSLLVDM
jgi:hypothetical protein